MARLEESIRGTVRLEICGAEPEALLNACLAEGLPLLAPQSVDAWTMRLGVFESDLPRLQALAKRHDCELQPLSRRGGSRNRRLLRRRLGLLLSGGLLLALVMLSSLFVWEIRFVGAEELSRGQLLRALEDCGLAAGSYWPGLDADELRDQMLLREPALCWLTVNYHGSVAEVRLLRRAEKPDIYRESDAADLRAGRAGVVRRISVLSGQPMIQPGQTVEAGELLISGSVDSITAAPRTLRAQGEVWADTWYEISAVCPPLMGKERAEDGIRGRLALKIAEKRINFYQNGGKTIDGCDKIVHEYTLGIKGLFRLPLTLVWEELHPYRPTGSVRGRGEEIGQRMLAALDERIDGEIVDFRFSSSEFHGMTVVTLYAQCRENIARLVDITQ